MEQEGLRQDFFISHASADKEQYIQLLANAMSQRGVTYWLDTIEMSWGDSLAMKINDDLRCSKYVLLCLSKNFLNRSWPETEMNTALTMQSKQRKKRVLPLILNSKDLVLQKYPIIGGLIYRHFKEGINTIGAALELMAEKTAVPEDHIQVSVESIHTGQLLNIVISPRVSVKWLAEKARQGAGLKDKADLGSFEHFEIRWVLIDANADLDWKDMNRSQKHRVHAIIKGDKGLQVSMNGEDRLKDLGIYNGIVFHLYPIENIVSDNKGAFFKL